MTSMFNGVSPLGGAHLMPRGYARDRIETVPTDIKKESIRIPLKENIEAPSALGGFRASRNQDIQPGPGSYLLPDREPPPWNPEQDLYHRWRRRVRCAAEGAEG